MNIFTLSEETEKCRERLENILSGYESAAVAFSGGIDSTLLLEAALRNEYSRAVAVIVRSALNPQNEIISAVEFLEKRNIDYMLIEADILSEESIASNPPDRCYHCKKFIFTRIMEAANQKGISVVLDGTHSEDLGDYRPGLKALSELRITSPLKEAGFKKGNIRELARYYGLSNWNSEASPCLATRIPCGTAILESDLRRVEKGEAFLKGLGLSPVRLRLHGNVARIETAADKIGEFSDRILCEKITGYIKSLGFDFAVLDLEGYRTGSMNLNR